MISVKSLRINDRLLVENLSITSQCGGVFGANGAGKSSLLKALSNLVDFTGSVECGGDCTYCGDISLISSDMLVYEILQYARGDKAPDKELLDRLIDHFKLSKLLQRELSSLSSGERQRVNLVCAFYLENKYTLLDEPTNHLDPIYIDLLSDFLSTWPLHYILVSHDLNFLCHNTDYLIGLENGKVSFNGELVKAIEEKAFDLVFKKRFNYQEFNGRKYIL